MLIIYHSFILELELGQILDHARIFSRERTAVATHRIYAHMLVLRFHVAILCDYAVCAHLQQLTDTSSPSVFVYAGLVTPLSSFDGIEGKLSVCGALQAKSAV